MNSSWVETITGAALRELFDTARPVTVGVEEEIMLLDPRSRDLVPRGRELLERMQLDPRFKTELPASQIEIATMPSATLDLVARELFDARRLLVERLENQALPAVAGIHPFTHPVTVITDSERYRHTLRRYGPVARQQLVCGLHVHLGLSGADRVLGVYNEMRNFLPEIAALAANAPIYQGRDTGLASIRPQLSGMLPRQGIPPALPSWEWLAAELRWGAFSGSLSRAGEWWWEMRPNLAVGTLEIRVPDAQTTVAEAIGVAALVAGLALSIYERLEAETPGDSVPDWRLGENRWSAARFGIEGSLADVRTGKQQRARDRLLQLVEEVATGSSAVVGETLGRVVELIEHPPAASQREIMGASGARGVAEWLADRFLEPPLREPVDRGSGSPSRKTSAERE